MNLSTARVTNLVHPGRPRVLRWHSVAVEWSTLPECQYQPLFRKKRKKCQMPLALISGAGTLTNDHSQKTTRTLNCRCFSGFEFVISLSSDWVLLPSSHLISFGTWMEIVAPEIQPVTQLITRSRCHPVKSIVWVFWAPGGFFWGREVFDSFSPSVLYLLVF